MVFIFNAPCIYFLRINVALLFAIFINRTPHYDLLFFLLENKSSNAGIPKIKTRATSPKINGKGSAKIIKRQMANTSKYANILISPKTNFIVFSLDLLI